MKSPFKLSIISTNSADFARTFGLSVALLLSSQIFSACTDALPGQQQAPENVQDHINRAQGFAIEARTEAERAERALDKYRDLEQRLDSALKRAELAERRCIEVEAKVKKLPKRTVVRKPSTPPEGSVPGAPTQVVPGQAGAVPQPTPAKPNLPYSASDAP